MTSSIDKKILVIVPAYNEEGNIRRAVDEITATGLPADIVVIDDGSIDATAATARDAGCAVITLPFNLGIGGAVQAGFAWALENKYAIVARLDGDGQHNASYLAPLVEPLMCDTADMVIGSRFIGPFVGFRSSFIRRIGITFFSRLLSFLTRRTVTDPTSGFRAYNQKMIRIFAEYYPHDFPEPEEVMIARRFSARVVEVPVEMRKRFSGHSSIRYIATLYYMVKVTFAIMLDMLKHTPENT